MWPLVTHKKAASVVLEAPKSSPQKGTAAPRWAVIGAPVQAAGLSRASFFLTQGESRDVSRGWAGGVA